MQWWRGRVLWLGCVLLLYALAMLLLSAITLYQPTHHHIPNNTPNHNGNGNSNNNNGNGKSIEHGQQSSRGKGYEYGGGGNGGVGGGGGMRGVGGRRARLQWCLGLRYLSPPRYPTALASFPGSGNTWLRYLLQQATGIYTGSVYKDYGLLKNGFPAESVVNGSVVVVKTHEWGPKARSPFAKAVLLVRAPQAAIQAEFNRQSGGHVGFASPDRYKRTKGKYWQQFVTDKLSAWKQTNLDWLHNFTGPTHVLFYEKLVENVEKSLRGILEFLDIPFTAQNLNCALDRKEGIYRRRKRVLNFDPYSSQMKKMIKEEQDKVYKAIYAAIGHR